MNHKGMNRIKASLAAAVLAAGAAPAWAAPEWRNWDAGATPRPADAGAAVPAPTPQQTILNEVMQRQQLLDLEVRELRDLIERQGYELEMLKKASKDSYADTDRRLRTLEQGGAAATVAGQDAAPASGEVEPATAATAPQVPQPVAPVDPQGGDQAAYDRAFDLLKAGKYDQAIKAFDSFAKTYPSSPNVPNAQYWAGEARYVQGDLKGAMSQFEQVVKGAPAHPKVPDALLKIGYVFYDQKNYAKARETLNRVKSQFPGSQAATLAEQRLKRMQQEGV